MGEAAILLYDPPSGWRYGFPKPYRPVEDEPLEQTLVRDGYPAKEAEFGARHCRFIGELSAMPPLPANDNQPPRRKTLADLAALPGLIYVCTPYTDYPLGHHAAAYDAARATAALMRKGLRAVSPVAHSHAVATVGGLDLVDGDFWQRQDAPLVEAASACVVVMLEGWMDSRGVQHEIGGFRAAGKPVVFVEPEELWG